MATGSEGPDLLGNDPNLAVETIDALGGDDSIFITNFNGQGVSTVTVDGGDGVDTLQLMGAPYIYELTANSAILMDGVPPEDTTAVMLSYSRVERMVVYGKAYTANGAPALWTTGSTSDEIHVLGTSQGASITVDTGDGDDKVYLQDVGSFSTVFAGAGNDLVDLSGALGVATNALGGEGSDHLIGSAGVNYLQGDNGKDILEGGDGNDILVGGSGGDTLRGGPGADIFRYESLQDSGPGGLDTIDFAPGIDIIDLSGIDADGQTPDDQAFRWIGMAAFTGTPGEIRAGLVGIQADIDGDKQVDMVIIVGVNARYMTAGDFVL